VRELPFLDVYLVQLPSRTSLTLCCVGRKEDVKVGGTSLRNRLAFFGDVYDGGGDRSTLSSADRRLDVVVVVVVVVDWSMHGGRGRMSPCNGSV